MEEEIGKRSAERKMKTVKPVIVILKEGVVRLLMVQGSNRETTLIIRISMKERTTVRERREGAQGLIVRPLASS